ncbi:malate synthase A [Pontibacter sp. G13]|uniref:malate synthase A n=1 Tax=Pontibacter sp. G13 TaxID=3074898 RepID=UPI002889AC8A|nr:malate synthase A [Pontibacter sp. G13]WNJ18134.1 malate synthase A [Pontibacter sp. G13]
MNPTTTKAYPCPAGVEILGEFDPRFLEVLTPEALQFVTELHRKFNPTRLGLLDLRLERQAALDRGEKPQFLAHTSSIREGDWKVAPVPHDLQDRRVEITGPVDRKMIINALNSGAKVFMADLEDSNSPTWENAMHGQINLRDAVRRTISFHDERKNKDYHLSAEIATLMVRPRGWHMEEKHILVDGAPISASLLDFGLFFYHNAFQLVARGTGPYFYLPKLESHLEARLWNDVFVYAQSILGVSLGTIKATVLVETILASFELNEILYELRDHSAGLNCGRWDYIFSYIKKFRNQPEFLLPDRGQVTMTVPFMDAYSKLVIQVCHKRGAHAMGGMAAQIPIKGDDAANQAALEKVRADKEREARAGHDGTWVAHPGLVSIAKEEFDKVMPGPHQIHRKLDSLRVTPEDLIEIPQGTITEQGLKTNIDVGIQYIAAWLDGNGCVPIYHLMEDAATAEISRSQVWQWIHHEEAKLEDGRPITQDLFRELLPGQLDHIRSVVGAERFDQGKFAEAAELFDDLVSSPTLEEFLTLKAYGQL